MTLWDVLSTFAATIALCGVLIVALGCVWPVDPLPRPQRRPHADPLLRRVATASGPTGWTCALPGVPLSLDDALRAMRYHRKHDCPRERVAFATLVAYGRATPTNSRNPARQKARS